MANSSATIFLFSSLLKNRRLLFEMAKRDISDRYAGQLLGPIWAILHPVTTILIFIFIFAVVFRVKVDDSLNIPGDHTLYIISGLIPWLVVADILGRSTFAVLGQASLVKQVVFPVEILPTKIVIASLPTFLIGFIGLLIYALIVGRFSPALLLFPVAGIPLYLFLFGVGFALSSIGIFLRDIKEFVQIYAMIGLYIAPIFYFMDWVPEKLRLLLYANPITFYIETFHDVAYYGEIRSLSIWVIATIIGLLSLWIGAAIFAKLKPHFGSYL